MDSIDYREYDWESRPWDYIVHLAPISPARVLKYAESHNARVLFVSSGAVYDRMDEYSSNKRLWEEQCKHSSADVVIARPFCFVGERLPLANFSIGQFIQDGIKGGPVRYYDIGCIRSYMYGADLGRWLWKILFDGSGVYDVGSSIALDMREVAHMVASVCGCDAVADLAPENDKPMIYMPNTDRAHALGCVETIGLRSAIERTVEYARG
jgi:nucleoside-diphosphate-sugar epimerase